MTNNATVLISENILQATADAIRNKGGTSGSIKPTDFAETIKAIAAGGLDTSDATATAEEIFQGKIAYAQGRKLTGTFTIDEELSTQDDLIAQIVTALEGKAAGSSGSDNIAKAMVTGTITKFEDNDITQIRDYTFAHCNDLTTVSFPVCTTIGVGAFTGCAALTTIDFPATISIGIDAFSQCKNLTTANFPVCTIIGEGAFCHCSNLTTIDFPTATSIGARAFRSCHSLITASFPTVTVIRDFAFSICKNLTTANFPACTTIDQNAFNHCSNLTTINFPMCENIGYGAFSTCSSLTAVDFPSATSIDKYAFLQCYRLSKLTLGISTVMCGLLNSNAFSSTPFAGYSAYFSDTPYIYVHGALLSGYKNATNWVYFSSYFKAIPGTEDESSSDVISFTIDGVQYQAAQGMDWYTWCNSTYNTGGFIIYDQYDCPYNATETAIIHRVTGDMLIVDGENYTLDFDI